MNRRKRLRWFAIVGFVLSATTAANLENPNEHGYDAIRRVFLLELVKERAAFGE